MSAPRLIGSDDGVAQLQHLYLTGAVCVCYAPSRAALCVGIAGAEHANSTQ